MTVPAPGGRPGPSGGRARPGRLGVGVVGAGRVGAVLGSALRSVGHPVVAASGISAGSRDRIDALLPGTPVLEVPDVVERAELVLLTVPDDALVPLVAGLAEVRAWQPGQLVLHTSGRYGTAVLGPARAAGAIPLAVHPAMTFTGTSLDLSRLVGCCFAVTAPAPVLPIAQALVVELGGEPVVIEEAARPLYHAALAHGANHLVVLVAQAAQALAAAGVDDAGRVLGPLLGAALDGALRASSVPDGPGAVATMTGPVARGDVGTVTEHLGELAALATRDAALDIPDAYRTLARAGTQRALAAGRLREDAAQALLDVLADPGAPPPGSGAPPAATPPGAPPAAPPAAPPGAPPAAPWGTPSPDAPPPRQPDVPEDPA